MMAACLSVSQARSVASQDLEDDWPQVPFIVCSEPLAGNAVWLAGNPTVHKADSLAACSLANVVAELLACDGFKTRPDRRWSQAAVRHARRQDAGRKCFPLHVSDRDKRARAGDVKGQVEAGNT